MRYVYTGDKVAKWLSDYVHLECDPVMRTSRQGRQVITRGRNGNTDHHPSRSKDRD